MAVNFGTGNTSRYYSVPDSTDFTLPDGDWAWIAVAKPQASANPRYLVSTNGAGAANSFNLLIASGTNYIGCQYNTNTFLEALPEPPSADAYHVLYATRRSGVMYVGWKPVGGGTGAESSGQAITGTSDGASLILAGRSDLDVNRMWQGSVSWAAFIPGKALSATEANDLATGSTVLMSSSYAGSVRNLWYTESATPSTITDSVNARVATKNGSGYSADDADPIPPYDVSLAGSASATATAAGELDGAPIELSGDAAATVTATGELAVVKGLSVVLYQKDATTLQASITGIKVRYWDGPTDTGAPLHESSSGSIDAGGVFNLDIDALTSLNIDDYGYLTLYKAGATPADDFHFSGRLPVVDIRA